MDRRSEDGTYRVLPDRGQPCVWMVAGLLSYRLCDRDYDCERCPLDAAIHGAPLASPGDGGTQPARAAPPAPDVPPALGIRDGLRYHPVYGWVAEAGGRLRWGIDGLTARLLDRVTAVVLPAAGTDLVQGKVACWVMDDEELVALRSPVSGTVERTNPTLRRDPTLMTHAPYGEGWLIEVGAGQGLTAQRGLCGAEERRAAGVGQLRRFHRAASGYLHVNMEVGPTAHDGGERLTDLRRLLGRARYHRLICTILR